MFRRDINGSEFVVWCAASSEGGMYVALFNIGEADAKIQLPLSELEINIPVNATELWSGQSGDVSDSVDVNLPRHGARVFYLNTV